MPINRRCEKVKWENETVSDDDEERNTLSADIVMRPALYVDERWRKKNTELKVRSMMMEQLINRVMERERDDAVGNEDKTTGSEWISRLHFLILFKFVHGDVSMTKRVAHIKKSEENMKNEASRRLGHD